MIRNSVSIHKLIYRSYLASSLIPIFTIEIILLLLYFGVSYFITQKSQEMLYVQASKNLLEITKREAQQIDSKLQEVSHLTQIMKKDHEHFFVSKECVLPNGKAEFKVHVNGAYYKPIDNGGSSIYYSTLTPLKEKQKLKSRCSEAIDPLMKNIVDTHPIITQAYLNTYDNFNRLYPYMIDAPAQYGPVLNPTNYNFYYLADATHNPLRVPVWTGAYLDPAGQGWMISNIVPIYRDDFLEGVSGLDVTIDSFVRNVLDLDLPSQGSAFMVDSEGMILAMPQEVESIFKLKELKEHIYENSIAHTIEKPEEYNLLKTPNIELRKQMESFFKDKQDFTTLSIDNAEYILTQRIVPETGWRLMIVLKKSMLFESIKELKKQIDTIGYIIILLMIFFYILFFLYLLRKSKTVASRISKPIHKLSVMSQDLGKKLQNKLNSDSGIQEVDQLSYNFNTLSQELDIRTNEYVQSQLRERMAEKDAEIAYRAGLFESASSYLHNIANSLTMLDAKVMLMKNVLVALSKTSMGFDRAKKLLESSSATTEQKEELGSYLHDFDKALSSDIFSEMEEITLSIESIKNHAIESIRHQQDIFNDSNVAMKNYVQDFDVSLMLENLVEDYRVNCLIKGINLELECEKSLKIETMKFQFQSGISNIIKNAIESIEQSEQYHTGKISIQASQKSHSINITIKDNGVGIETQNISNLFKAGYTTKNSGHGLGLHAFNNFLNAHNGNIRLFSQGPQTGATVSINMGVAKNEK